MQIHNVQQGSPEWLALRRQYFTASEAPAMMGVSPYITRNELLRQKATGLTPEVDEHQQSRFDAGHMAEASYRPIAEEQIGEELYPVTGTAHIHGLQLLASFDGLTMDERIGFEHKLLNQNIVEHLVAHGEPGPAYYWQLEHQLLVSGAEKILFATSNGTADGAVAYWYKSKPERRAALIAGWRQFAIDLAEWKPAPAAPEKVVAEPVESLPAPVVQVSGQLALTDNFKVFEERLREFLDNRLIREPKTDEDFVNLDAQIKAMKAGREALKSAKAQMLAQVQPIDQASKTADMLDTLLQQNCAMAERLLKDEKERRKGQIVEAGVIGLQAHVTALNARLGKPYMPLQSHTADFVGAIKGMRSLASMEDAVSTALANAKIRTNEIADRIQLNLDHLRAEAADYAFLFADTAQIVLKAPEDLQALVANRINAHKQAEAERLEKERAAIAEQERKKAEEKVRAEQAAAAKADQEARDAMARAAAPVAQGAPSEPESTIAQSMQPRVVATLGAARSFATRPAVQAAAPAPIEVPPTLRMGAICERLGFIINVAFLEQIGVTPAGHDIRKMPLFHDHQFEDIGLALIRHIESVIETAPA